MSKSGVSRAEANKKIRAEALREQLKAGGHIQHIVDITEKLSNLDIDLTQLEVTRLKAAADIKNKLVDKYLPALTAVHNTHDNGEQTLDDWINGLENPESPITKD